MSSGRAESSTARKFLYSRKNLTCPSTGCVSVCLRACVFVLCLGVPCLYTLQNLTRPHPETLTPPAQTHLTAPALSVTPQLPMETPPPPTPFR